MMKRTLTIAIALTLLLLPCSAQVTPEDRAFGLLGRVPLIDGHNDTPWQYRKRVNCNLDRIDLRSDTSRLWPPMHTDLNRLSEGQVGAQFWSVYLPTDQPNAVAAFHNQVRLVHRLIDRYPDLSLATTADDIEKLHEHRKIASLIGVEGGHALGGGSLGELRWLYQNGVRYLTLTHTKSNAIADSSDGPRLHGGLSEKGRAVVKEMNRLGMMIDLSHTSDETAAQVLELSSKPVLFTHSNSRALVPESRNVGDRLLKALKSNDGVIMLSFVPSFVNRDEDRATLSDVADHAEYIKALIGSRHLGIGADFDGIRRGPQGLEDVSKYPALFAELYRRGWSDQELEGLAGKNVLRVMRENER